VVKFVNTFIIWIPIGYHNLKSCKFDIEFLHINVEYKCQKELGVRKFNIMLKSMLQSSNDITFEWRHNAI
jgi:hypothetical protein